jgi:hypothetical protein
MKIIGVILGGIITLLVSKYISSREQKIRIYSEFVRNIHTRKMTNLTDWNSYFISLNNVLLICSKKTLLLLTKYNYIPQDENLEEFHSPNEEHFDEIIIRLRKDIGFKTFKMKFPNCAYSGISKNH